MGVAMDDELERANARIAQLEYNNRSAYARISVLVDENNAMRLRIDGGYLETLDPHRQEVRLNPDGTIDEVVANHVHFHCEQMDTTNWWIGVDRGNEMLHLDFHSKAKIRLTVRNEGFIPGGLPDYGFPAKGGKK